MTEERAIEIININLHHGNLTLALDVARKSINELQQYRAIGTVEECKTYKDACGVCNLAQLSEYRAVGTVEECREARERQRRKKRIKGKIFKSLGYYQCPMCGGLLMRNEKFCSGCGQAILQED